MHKITKRILSCIMATALTVAAVPYTGPLKFENTVNAATDLAQYDDDEIVSQEIVKSNELLNALKEIILEDGETNLTFGMLKGYTGAIDLTNYPNINDVRGLGYAINASSIDLSALTKVNKIYASEFKQCKFTEFKLPANIVEIEAQAFLDCNNLKTIDLPESLTKIGSQAFENCSELDGVILPANLDKLGDESFANCKKLKKITIPDKLDAAIESGSGESLLGIGAGVFSGCTKLTEINLGAGMTMIPASFLQNAESLRKIDIPSKIKDIRVNAFAGSGITSIDLSENTEMTAIHSMTFSGCVYLSSVKLPSGITLIDSNAFNSCHSLKNTDFLKGLDKLDRIGDYAFANSGFVSAYIPGNVTKIGRSAFSECDSLQKVEIADFTYDVTEETTKVIDNYAFSKCDVLYEVVLPDENEDNKNIKLEIGQYAFTECRFLEKINFPLNLSKIGDYAFYKCYYNNTDWKNEFDEFPGVHKGEGGYVSVDNISKVPVDGKEKYIISTSTIGYEEYYQPTVVYIDPDDLYVDEVYNAYMDTDPETFAQMYPDLAERYSKVTGYELYIYYEPQVEKYIDVRNIYNRYNVISTEDENYTKLTLVYVSDYYVHTSRETGDLEYTVTDGVYSHTVYINPDYVFRKPDVKEKTLRDSADDESLPYLAYISEADLHDSAESEFDSSYIVTGPKYMHTQHLTGLREIDLSNNLNLEIGKGAFSECKNLRKAALPKDMTVIPDELFKNCYAEKYASNNGIHILNYKNVTDEWYYGLESVEMSDNVTEIGKSAFENCYKLVLTEEKNLPGKLVTIKDRAYANCQSLGSIVLPRTLEYIGNSAFSGCSRVFEDESSKNFGLIKCDATGASSLEYIGTSAFANCSFDTFRMNGSAKVNYIPNGTFSGCQYLRIIEFSPSVKYVGKNSLSYCYRLESVTVPDTCVLDYEMCLGAKTSSYLPKSLPCYTEQMDDGTVKYYFHTNTFALSVKITNNKIGVRENGKMVMPLSNVDGDGTSFYKLVKVGENSAYNYNESTQTLEASVESDYLYPESDKAQRIKIDATKYYNKDREEAMCGIILNGLKEVQGLNVVVEEELHFIISKADNTMIATATQAQYSVDVTKNPCNQIVADDRVYVDLKSSKTVSPEYVAKYPDSDITDKVSWNIESGDDLIELIPSEDGKTAQIKSKQSGYGTASIKVTAGEASKVIDVNIAVPASKITLAQKNIEVAAGGSVDLSPQLSYATADQANAELYGDNVKYISSDESVVKIEEYAGEDGITHCKLVAVSYGEAVITVVSMTKESVKATCTVNVASEDIGMTITDINGETIASNHDLYLINTESITYNYAIDSELNLNNVSYKEDVPGIIDFTFNTSNKTFKIKGKKAGSTRVVVYPSAADPEKNGFEMYVTIGADVKSIVLYNREVAVGTTTNVFKEMTNIFGETVSESSQEAFKTITDNRIEFTSSDDSIASVDENGNVTAHMYKSSNDRVTVTCTAYRGEEEIASRAINVFIQKEGTIVTTGPDAGSDEEPVTPTGVTAVCNKSGTITVNANNPGNGQQFIVYLDGEEYDVVSSLPYEITGLDEGKYLVYLTGYINKKESAISNMINVVVEDKAGTEPATTVATTTAATTTKAPETTMKPATPTTKAPETTKAQETSKTENVTTAKTTDVQQTTKTPDASNNNQSVLNNGNQNVSQSAQEATDKNVVVGKAKIKKATRTKNNKKAKLTLSKVSGVSGYQIAYSTNKKFKKKLTKTVNVKKVKATIKKLKAKKKYYVRVRAYVTVGGKKVYGKWSKAKVLKVKK